MFNIVGKRNLFFILSGVLVLASIVSLATAGLKRGIEFSGGSLLTVSFEQKVSQQDVRQEMVNLGYGNAIVQTTTGGSFYIRTVELDNDEKLRIEDGLRARFGNLTESGFSSTSPLVAGETASNAAIAVAVASLAILLYLAWAFRRMPNPFQFGACAVIAMLHDVVVLAGVFSILGALLDWEINLMFVTGVLAIVGISTNNIVIIFDRVRENMKRGVSPNFEVVVNDSVVQTLARNLNVTITTLVTVAAVWFFVGATIQNLAAVLFIGVLVGTYDSICVAPSLLAAWQTGRWRRAGA